MGLLKLDYGLKSFGKRHAHLTLSTAEFNLFNPEILGLGNISAEGEKIDALAAVFDLEGFTSFCNQMEPHLVIPEFLNDFLKWLFNKTSGEFIKSRTTKKVVIWGSLPFFAKFLGDGILFIWDTNYGGGLPGIGNIVTNLRIVCASYVTEFLPSAKKKFVRPPTRLRCGVARGQIVSIGNGEDFVGPCINLASRLQKLSQLSFACQRRGFNPEECFSEWDWADELVVKKISIRGIGEDELVIIDKREFQKLSREDKAIFKNP